MAWGTLRHTGRRASSLCPRSDTPSAAAAVVFTRAFSAHTQARDLKRESGKMIESLDKELDGGGDEPEPGPLHGIRVLDLTRVL
ncbi:hypothetical protein BGZ54_002519, partial [Gamsiella multidivaricata]